MQRPLLPILILAAALVIGLAYYFYGGLQVPTVAPSPQPDQESAGPNGLSAANSDVQVNAQSGMSREAVDGGQGPLLNDPEIRAGLCGFRGRVVNHAKVPVADCGVRIYRGAVDSILKMRGDLFADEEAFEPQYIAGEVRTAVDGKFEMTGVWPRGRSATAKSSRG